MPSGLHVHELDITGAAHAKLFGESFGAATCRVLPGAVALSRLMVPIRFGPCSRINYLVRERRPRARRMPVHLVHSKHAPRQ